MRRRCLPVFVLASLCGARLAYGIDPSSIPDPVLEARYLALTHELRCMQCQNESIADSPVGLASDLRREVRDMLLAGKSDEDVRNYMVSRYGEFILFRPRFSLRNAWLWLAPPLLLLMGLTVAVRVVRQRSALLASDPDTNENEPGG
jgi:cytochrome c-type biogenesis protein CcmH